MLYQFISPYQFLATTDCFIVFLILPFSRMSHSWNRIVHRLFRSVCSSGAFEMPRVICPWGLWSHPRDTWTPSWQGPITYEKAGAKVISEGEPPVFCGVMLLKLSITSWTTPHSPLPNPSLKKIGTKFLEKGNFGNIIEVHSSTYFACDLKNNFKPCGRWALSLAWHSHQPRQKKDLSSTTLGWLHQAGSSRRTPSAWKD